MKHRWQCLAVWRRAFVLVFAASLAATTGLVLTRTTVIAIYANTETTTLPFTLETEVYHYENKEAGELLSRSIVARRSDGSSVTMSTVLGPKGLEAGLIARRLMFPDGRSVTVFDWLKSKTTWPQLSGESLIRVKKRFLNPPDNCLASGETLLGPDTVIGQPTVMIRRQPVGKTVTTYWRAPALACEKVQYRVEAIAPDGSMKLQAVAKPISLKMGEPVAWLFDEGTTYTERSPSETIRLGLEKLGVKWDDSMRSGEHKVSDQVYFGSKANK